MWKEALTSLAVYSVPFGIVAYLCKILITHFLDKDISAFRKSLENDAAAFKHSLENSARLDIEKYKSQLEIERLRLQISYGGIFEKQANAIHEIYRGLLELERASGIAIDSGRNEKPTNQEVFRNSWRVVKESYNNNRILLPEDIDAALEKFINDIFRNVMRYTRIERVDFTGVSDDEYERLMDKQEQAAQVIERDLPELKELLINNMRKTLGVVH